MPVKFPVGDVWSAGQPYEHYVGCWSRGVARFIAWLGLPSSRGQPQVAEIHAGKSCEFGMTFHAD